VSKHRMAKKVTIALASVATVFAFTSATASAAPISHVKLSPSYEKFAAHATPAQNTAILRMLTSYPGGTRVSVYKVEWPDGVSFTDDGPKLTAETAAGDFTECSGTTLNGACLIKPQTSSDVWYAYGASINVVQSWFNDTTARVWLEQFQDSGNELCIAPYENDDYIGYDYTGVDDHDYWTLLTTNKAVC
jgi:hypothetical protein